VNHRTAFFNKLEKAGTFAENAVLVTILVSMILLAGSQIFLRNFFDYGFFWGDEVLRLMVLWLTLAGGMAASRKGKHISIAVLDRFMPDTMQLVVRILMDLITALVCGLLSWHSTRFVSDSYEYGDTLIKNTPAWMLQIILPVGFGLMAYRHVVLAIKRPVETSTGDISQ